MTRAGIYTRISLDRQDGAGVERQRQDCEALARSRGWEVVEWYTDNDVSAFRARRRPEFERMLGDLTDRRLDAIIAYHSDRLYRHPSDLDDIIDVVEQCRAEVATVRAGDIDLTTASGRMVARILGSVSRHEVERMGERVSRAKRQAAAEGRPAGGGMRPYGLTADRTALVPDEADVIRSVVDAVMAGESIGSEVRRLNEAGIRTASGKHWTAGNLSRVIVSPHVGGVRTYKGEIVADATSPAIIDREAWDQLWAMHKARKRGRPQNPRYLLSGVLVCSLCENPLRNVAARNKRRNYACIARWEERQRGCGKIAISGVALEEHVVDTITGWVADPEFVTELADHLEAERSPQGAAQSELDEVDRRTAVLTGLYSKGDLREEEWREARAILSRRRDELEARVLGQPRAIRGASARDLVRVWTGDRMSDVTRRGLIETLLAWPLPVLAGRDEQGVRRALGERVVLRPKWEAEGPEAAK